MPRLRHRPAFWLAAFLVWFATLWTLSSFAGPGEQLPTVPHIDKVAHFGFFFGGSGLLCAWLFRRDPRLPHWPRLILTAVVVIGLVGWLDEYHQSQVPGRFGNDLFDWIADVLGGLSGALVFKALHRQLM
ncbi:MAG: VanZ family protein [Verrucomicrobiota bacterium]